MLFEYCICLDQDQTSDKSDLWAKTFIVFRTRISRSDDIHKLIPWLEIFVSACAEFLNCLIKVPVKYFCYFIYTRAEQKVCGISS